MATCRLFSGGSGTKADPFLISSAGDFLALCRLKDRWGACYRQTTTIEFSRWEGLSPIGDVLAPFTGDYDGCSYELKNVVIEMPTSNYVGIFGVLKNGRLRDIVARVEITGSSHVGGLVGAALGSDIQNGHIYGSVQGSRFVGGVAGSIRNVFLTGVFSSVDVIGQTHVGGIVGGSLADAIVSCSAFGNTRGRHTIGDIAGGGCGVYECYAENPAIIV